MLFKEIIVVYYKNHTERRNANGKFLMLKRDVHAAITGLQKVQVFHKNNK